MLKGAIIGFGQVAEKAHVPAWKESRDFSILAVADENQERTRLAAQYFPGIRTYKSLEELLRSEPALDFVDIATPPFLHAPKVIRCLQHQCHVLCEKPLALTQKDFENIRTKAASRDRVVFTVHNWKYSPLFMQAVRLVQSGAIGAIHHIQLHTLRNKPASNARTDTWRTNRIMSGGGILVDHGWHNFYLLRQFLRPDPRGLAAHMHFPHPDGVEDEAACHLKYSGASAILYMSWRAASRSNWGILYGTQGTLEIRDDILILNRKNHPPQYFEFAEKLSQGSVHPNWFQSMLEDFKVEIQNPQMRNQNLREAEMCLSLLTNSYESQRLGGKIISLGRARKDGDGIMARYFDRHISTRITSALLKTPLTPNHVTFISTGIGLLGALQFLRFEHKFAVIGAALIWLHTVLDGCDGEMARLTFRESRWGAFFDFWGDNVVHLALFSSMAVGLYSQDPRTLWLGISACAGTLGSALISYTNSLSKIQTPSGMRRTLLKLEILLAQRDFIYLLVFAAAANRIEWFLWAAGIGAPLYLAAMIYLQLWVNVNRPQAPWQISLKTAVPNDLAELKVKEEITA